MLYEKQKFTPAMASALIQATIDSGFNNRPMSAPVVKRYAHDMLSGKFYSDQTGETLKIAKRKGKDVLIDGQHRMAALAAAGGAAVPGMPKLVMPQTDPKIALQFLVADGIKEEMFQFIDGGKPRTLSDLMSILGSPLAAHAKVYATTGYMLYKDDNTDDPRIKPNAENTDGTGAMLAFINEEYTDHMAAIYEKFTNELNAASKNGMGASSLWLYFMVRMMARDTTLAAKFLRYVSSYGACEPCSKNLYFAAKLMEKLRVEHSENGQVKKARYKDFIDGVMDAWVLAWNLTREGTHLKSQSTFNAKFNAQRQSGWPGIN